MADPGSIALVRALARAEAEAGDLSAAVTLLEGSAPAQPDKVHAHLIWDRAALRARAGQVSEAAADVRRCLHLGIDARALAADPDLAPVRADPVHGQLLPTVEVRVRESAPTTEVLLGESWQRIVELSAPPGAPVIEAVGALPPGLALREVVEDVVTADEWTENRRIRLRYEAVAPGAAHMPAHQVSVGRKSAALSPRQVEVVAVGQMRASSDVEMTSIKMTVPSSFSGTPVKPELLERDGSVVLRWPSHADCKVTPRPPDSVDLVVRQGGQPRWKGLVARVGSGAAWTCGRGGTVSESGVLP